MAEQAAKDSPSPGGEGRGEGGRFNKINAPRFEQLELLQRARRFGGQEGGHVQPLKAALGFGA